MSYDISKSSRKTTNQRVIQNYKQSKSPSKDSVDDKKTSNKLSGSINSNEKNILNYLIIAIVAVVLLVQSGLIIYFARDVQLSLGNGKELIETINEKIDLNSEEVPLVSIIINANSLRAANIIQAEIYANAENGDYVILHAGEMIIYRDETGEVIYRGDTPAKKASANQTAFIQEVKGKAVEEGYLSEDEDELPQISIVDEDSLEVYQSSDSEFYEEILEGDAIVIFQRLGLIMIYRPSSEEFIRVSEYSTSIN